MQLEKYHDLIEELQGKVEKLDFIQGDMKIRMAEIKASIVKCDQRKTRLQEEIREFQEIRFTMED